MAGGEVSASIKLTTELLLVMPDILTSQKGADTRVFEVHRQSLGVIAMPSTPTAIVLLAQILSAISKKRELLNKQWTEMDFFSVTQSNSEID